MIIFVNNAQGMIFNMETNQQKISVTQVKPEDFFTNLPTDEQFRRCEELTVNIRKTEKQITRLCDKLDYTRMTSGERLKLVTKLKGLKTKLFGLYDIRQCRTK